MQGHVYAAIGVQTRNDVHLPAELLLHQCILLAFWAPLATSLVQGRHPGLVYNQNAFAVGQRWQENLRPVLSEHERPILVAQHRSMAHISEAHVEMAAEDLAHAVLLDVDIEVLGHPVHHLLCVPDIAAVSLHSLHRLLDGGILLLPPLFLPALLDQEVLVLFE